MNRPRKILSLILTVAMVFTALPGTGIFISYADDTYTVSMSSDVTDVTAGGTFNVTLRVSSSSESAGAAALHTEIKYDNSKLEFVKAAAPTGVDLITDAAAENGIITVDSYGVSQAASGSGAAMAVLTFKSLDSTSESTQLSFVSGKSLVGVSGDTAEIKAVEGAALEIKAAEAKYDIKFGLPDDGLTWNILTVNGETVNKSYKGGETASSAVAVGDTMTFSITPDEGVKYTNVMAYRNMLQSRDYDVFVKEENGIYTINMPEEKAYQAETYNINATTLRVDESEYGNIDVSLKENKQSKAPGTRSYGTDEIYPSIEASFTPNEGSRLVRWSYKCGRTGNLEAQTSNDLGSGTLGDDGKYILNKEEMPERIYYLYYSGRAGDESNFGFELTNTCYILTVEAAQEAITSISTEDDLIKFAKSVNEGDPYKDITVKLENDITLTKPWTDPIGADASHVFSGTFDGNGKSIKGLDIDYIFTDSENNDAYAGKIQGKAFALFGYLSGAVVKNLTVSGNINIDNTAVDFDYEKVGPQSYISGIAASASNTDFTGCVSEVDIKAHGGYIGGILAFVTDIVNNSVTFTDCFNYGNIEVTRRNTSACGIAGKGEVKSMLRCGNYGNITVGGTQVKSIVGSAAHSGSTETTTRSDDTATGTAAGLAAKCFNVTECFNKGSIKGLSAVSAGLLAGEQYYLSGNGEVNAVIKDSYNTGSIELPIEHLDWSAVDNNKAYTSGLIGHFTGTVSITNCYNSGSVISKTTTNGKSAQLYIADSGLTVTTENVYASDTDPSVTGLKAAALNTSDTAKFKDDETSINGGMPLLIWEQSEASDEKYDVTFDMKDVKGSVAVYSDAARTKVIDADGDGKYSLKAGTYYYTAKADGYEDVLGSFSVVKAAVNVEVNFRAVVDVTVTVKPADATLTLTAGSETVQPVSSANGTYKFTLYKDTDYVYTATASGYNGQTKTFRADGTPVNIQLTKSSSGGATEDSYIYGSYNTGKNSKITKGGTYYVKNGDGKDGAQGTITIDTTEPVTLVGTGVSSRDVYEYLFIDCVKADTDLTLQDIYISNVGEQSNAEKVGNMIDFTGKGNSLKWKGTSILDLDQNAAGYAMIHVNQNASLTMGGESDDDVLYMYKKEQGAGIGGNGGAKGSDGQTAETNGDITFTGGILFAKNTKQGAFFGAGAESASAGLTPGTIRFTGGIINLIANSRSAAIGGSAGSSGASEGSDVYVDGASININVDFSGAAIGGGGYASGNDSDGGTLYYSSGSIRTYIDENAVSNWSDKGVSEAGVNGNIGVTADVVNSRGDKLYLLELDTSKLSKSASSFTVKEGNTTIYSGGLHEYRYVNDGTEKGGQATVNYTIDNWTTLDDSNLYLYFTGEDHSLDVNGAAVTAKWDAAAKTFTLTYPDGSSTSGGGGGGSITDNKTPLVSETVKPDVKVEGSDASADVKKDDIDGAVKAVGSSSNANITIEAGSGKTGINHAEVTIPMDSVKSIQKDTKADVIIKTDLGDITVDHNDLSALTAGTGSDVTFTIDKNSDGSMKVNTTSGGKNLAAGKYILDYKYKADDSVINALTGKTGINNSDLVGVTVGAAGADGQAAKTIIRDSFVTSDGYVVLKAAAGDIVTIAANGRTFSDVADSAWYREAVGFAVSHELFNGVSDTEFAPTKSMTRGMFVTVLARLADQEDYSGNAEFTDVASDAWYAAGVAWASSKGIVSGYGDGKFGPNDEVTREQMALIMYNFTKAMGYDITGSASLDKFSDSASVHSWAADAMKWAAGTGIMSGNTDGTLNPRGTATRAQVATIMMNYVEVLLGVK